MNFLSEANKGISGQIYLFLRFYYQKRFKWVLQINQLSIENCVVHTNFNQEKYKAHSHR